MTVLLRIKRSAIPAMVAAALLGAAAPAPPPDLVVLPGGDLENIRLVPGQRLDLRLAVSFSIGISWVVAKIEGDAVSFEGTTGLYGPDAGPDLPQGVDVQSLIFLAKAPGEATIELHLRRPWEPDAPPRRVRRFVVTVEKSAHDTLK